MNLIVDLISTINDSRVCVLTGVLSICLISGIVTRIRHFFYNIPVLAILSGQIGTSTEDAYLLYSTGLYLILLSLYIHPKEDVYRHDIRGKKTTQGSNAF